MEFSPCTTCRILQGPMGNILCFQTFSLCCFSITLCRLAQVAKNVAKRREKKKREKETLWDQGINDIS